MQELGRSCLRAWQNQRKIILAGALLALVCGLLSLLLIAQIGQEGSLVELDRRVNQWANSKALYDKQERTWAVQVMHWTGELFSTAYVMVLLTLLTIVRLRKQRLELAAILASLVLVKITHLGVQALVDRPRPESVFVNPPFSSFPSGHIMTTVFFIGGLSWLIFRRTPPGVMRYLLVVDAVLIILFSGWSRIYLGAHWLSDVLGGILLAGGWLGLVIGWATAIERCAPEAPAPMGKLLVPGS
jgi:membrane-associated phospholipid phosphatase